ncbi:MAG: response regulator transcription factor [Candidatus Omnitrophota bacterium]|nr:response regulator transcription factor [Candidatus Omnitrophota bacterium]
MNEYLIAVVDDESEVLRVISEYFIPRGFKVKGFQDSACFFDFIGKKLPDIIILDVMFPGENGFDLCKKLKSRKIHAHIPIIMLSGKIEEQDKIFGLELGADDYVSKPFSLNELHARVEAVLRRCLPEDLPSEIRVGDLIAIDTDKYEVRVSGKKIDLTSTEFKILECLSARKGHAFTRNKILEYIWGDEKIVTEQTINVHINHIREKLGQKAGKLIKHIRGMGYKVEDTP